MVTMETGIVRDWCRYIYYHLNRRSPSLSPWVVYSLL